MDSARNRVLVGYYGMRQQRRRAHHPDGPSVRSMLCGLSLNTHCSLLPRFGEYCEALCAAFSRSYPNALAWWGLPGEGRPGRFAAARRPARRGLSVR